MKGSSKALLWVILVFATGAIFGSVTSFLVVKNRAAGIEERSRSSRPNSSREQRFLQRMMGQLDLDAEQEEEMRAILERNRERVKQIEGERHKSIRRLRRETMREIKAVLRPEQQEKLDDFLKRLRRRSRTDRKP